MVTPWAKFRTTATGELMTGSAHQSHPTDLTAPLPVRFAGQSLLAVHVALEKAATVRVTFDADGAPTLTGVRNVNRRDSAEFIQILRSEAAAIGAKWAVAVLATGWHAVLGQRAARPEPGERASPFSRYKVMLESPELVYPRAQPDWVYTAVDHPVLDRSIVFSMRRPDLEDLFGKIRAAGLGVASAKITIAAQLETWLAGHGDAALERDLLITDALGALLLNTEMGDFVGPSGAADAELPRQSVQRPSTTEEDIIRFVAANGRRAITFIGPQESYEAVKRHAVNVAITRPSGDAAHNTNMAALGRCVRHDLNFEAKEVRPAVPRKWRRVILGYVTVVALLGLIAIINVTYAVRMAYHTYAVARESARYAADAAADNATVDRIAGELADARALQAWVCANIHAQEFCYALLRDVPANAAVDKLLVEANGGQITITFVVLGDQAAQLATRRAMENSISGVRYSIAAEEPPSANAVGGNAVQYRIHVIVPDAARHSVS